MLGNVSVNVLRLKHLCIVEDTLQRSLVYTEINIEFTHVNASHVWFAE
ncbi:MAG: hypothetical protein QXI11_04675 [Thermoproteota archaeon]